MTQQKMRTWAEIDLEAVKHNVRAMKAALPEKTKFLAVVKADAYGHGAIPVAKAALEAGAEYLAVACLCEAEELRAAGIDSPILILGITPAEYAERLRELNITQAVSGLKYAKKLSANLKGELKVHMKLDTGMSRTGFDTTHSEKLEDIVKAMALPNLNFEGVFTHFAVSDEYGDPFTARQHGLFTHVVSTAEILSGHHFAIKHCANSGAVVNYKELAHDMVRPGVMLYGMYPASEHGGIELKPVMSLKSRVYAITNHEEGDTVSYGRTYTVTEPTRLAVVPIGYADGLHRTLSNKLEVLIRGKRCRQVGRICMDMCMVDISEVPECCEGDVVTLIGAEGDECILASELAEKCGTINYEISCGFTKRVPRLYI